MNVKLPTVVDAAEPLFLVAPEEQRRRPVRTARVDDPYVSIRVAKGDEVLAEMAGADRITVGVGTSSDNSAGNQKRRSSSPIGVPGPTRVRTPLSLAVSTEHPPATSSSPRVPRRWQAVKQGRAGEPPRCSPRHPGVPRSKC
jgi:hypothetical protein